jgi:hypothetical protein
VGRPTAGELQAAGWTPHDLTLPERGPPLLTRRTALLVGAPLAVWAAALAAESSTQVVVESIASFVLTVAGFLALMLLLQLLTLGRVSFVSLHEELHTLALRAAGAEQRRISVGVRNPVPCRNSGRISGGSPFVLMDEAVEPITAHDLAGRRRRLTAGPRGLLPERLVRSRGVVMVGVLAEHPLEVPATEDQQPIQALTPDRADLAFGDRVRARRPDRRPDHAHAFGSEHVVERARELGVSIADQHRGVDARLVPVPHEVAGLLGHPRGGRGAVQPATNTRRVWSSMKRSTYSVRSRTVSAVKKSHSSTAPAWAPRKARQDQPARRGAGGTPLRRRVVWIAVAETSWPSLRNSPQMRW